MKTLNILKYASTLVGAGILARALSSPPDQDRVTNYSNLRRKLGPHFREQG